jgi:hypothetical protein
VADDLVAACIKLLQRIGKVLGNAAIGIDRSLNIIAVESVQNAPDTRFAAVLAIRERGVIGLISFMAPVLRRFFESLEGDEETDRDLGIAGTTRSSC